MVQESTTWWDVLGLLNRNLKRKGHARDGPTTTGLLGGHNRKGRPLHTFPPILARKVAFVHETDPYTRDPGPNLHKPHTNRPQTCGVYANPHTPRPRITEYGLCTLVKSFTNPHPMEASPQRLGRPPGPRSGPYPHKPVGSLLRPSMPRGVGKSTSLREGPIKGPIKGSDAQNCQRHVL